MTQLELANSLGISFQDLQQIESSMREVTRPLLKKIAAIQDMQLSYYLDD